MFLWKRTITENKQVAFAFNRENLIKKLDDFQVKNVDKNFNCSLFYPLRVYVAKFFYQKNRAAIVMIITHFKMLWLPCRYLLAIIITVHTHQWNHNAQTDSTTARQTYNRKHKSPTCAAYKEVRTLTQLRWDLSAKSEVFGVLMYARTLVLQNTDINLLICSYTRNIAFINIYHRVVA